METLRASSRLEQFDQRQRDYDDLTTLFAEMVGGQMQTEFEYRFDGHELYAQDGGAMGPVFEKSLEEATWLAQANPRLGFEARRRQHEREEYNDMLRMASGDLPNTMVVVSDFPPELMNSAHDVGGYNVTRRQTMLRVITWDGQKLKMTSQSLDGSVRPALEAIYHRLGYMPGQGELLGQRVHLQTDAAEQMFVPQRLIGAYDTELSRIYGGSWYAGRRDVMRQNTYEFVRRQRDIIDYALDAKAKGQMDLFALASTLDGRFQAGWPAKLFMRSENFNPAVLRQEINMYAVEAKLMGKVFSACGVSVEAKSDSTGGELSASGYGNQAELKDCEFTSKECPKCHQKNVKTVVKKGRYFGACGCKS